MNERVFVIEDDENIQEIVKLALESSGYEITLFDNAIDAIVAIHENPPDLAIFDIMLPELDGISAIKKIRETNTSMPIMVLSAKDREIDKVRGLDSGCDDYMTKPFVPDELLARIRALTRRQGEVQMNEAEFGDITLNLSTGDLACRGKNIHLNFKESEILKLLMANPNSAVSKEDLITKVWGYDSDASDNNVEAYISFLRKKLSFLDSHVSITALRKIGYRLEENQ